MDSGWALRARPSGIEGFGRFGVAPSGLELMVLHGGPLLKIHGRFRGLGVEGFRGLGFRGLGFRVFVGFRV